MAELTQSRLAELVEPPEARALAALRCGDLPTLGAVLAEMASGQAGLDALTLHALARKIGKLRQDFGEGKAREVLARIGAQLMKTWVAQVQGGDLRGAIADLVAVYKHQGAARLEPLVESPTEVIRSDRRAASGARPDRHRRSASRSAQRLDAVA